MRFSELFCWILVIQLILWHLSSTCHDQLEVIILKCAQTISWLATKGCSVWSFLHLQEQFLQTIYNYLTHVQLNPFYSRSCLWGTYWNSHVLNAGYLTKHVRIVPINCPVHSQDCSGESPGVTKIPTRTVSVKNKANILLWKKLGVRSPCHGSLHCSKSVYHLIFAGSNWGGPWSPRKLRTKQIQCVHRQSLITSYSTTVTIISYLYQNHNQNTIDFITAVISIFIWINIFCSWTLYKPHSTCKEGGLFVFHSVFM